MGLHPWSHASPVLQVYEMRPLTGEELQQYGLAANEASWCGVFVDIPASAAVVDFVVSDR